MLSFGEKSTGLLSPSKAAVYCGFYYITGRLCPQQMHGHNLYYLPQKEKCHTRSAGVWVEGPVTRCDNLCRNFAAGMRGSLGTQENRSGFSRAPLWLSSLRGNASESHRIRYERIMMEAIQPKGREQESLKKFFVPKNSAAVPLLYILITSGNKETIS